MGHAPTSAVAQSKMLWLFCSNRRLLNQLADGRIYLLSNSGSYKFVPKKQYTYISVLIHAVYTTDSNIMKLPETGTENIPEKVIKMLYRRFVHAGKTFNRFANFGL